MSNGIRYEDFTLELAEDGRGEPRVQVVHSLEGGASAPFCPPYPGAELGRLLKRLEAVVLEARDFALAGAGRAEQHPPEPREVGTALFRSLFPGRVAERFAYSRGRTAGDAGAGLRLRLLLPPDLGDPPLATLPWELLHDPERREFLGRSRLTPIVRCLDVPGSTVPPPVEPPLRVLVAIAAPSGTRPLDLEAERRRIHEAWGRQPGVELEWLPAATLEGVRERLRREPFHVFHFMGHGTFPDDGGDTPSPSALLFEDGDGGPRPAPAELLAATLGDLPTLRLAVLNACDTGRFPRRRGVDPYSGVAAALAATALPAVVAMQFPVSDGAALAFSTALYRSLAAGDPVEAAVAEGRHGILRHEPEGWQWATPVLFLRGRDGRLLRGLVRQHRIPPRVEKRILDASELVEEKTRGFVGRGFVYEAAESFFHDHDSGYFRVVGEPGIGKTALAAELVRRHGHVHHFNRRSDGIVRPEAFLSNACAQLIARYGLDHDSLPDDAVQDAAFLQRLLGEVSDRLGRDERCLLLVDALDESDVDGLPTGANPLFLPATLPAGVFAFVTARPSIPLRTDDSFGHLELLADDPRNLADVRELVESYLGRPGIRDYRRGAGLSEGRFVDLMVERSEGNFMYLSYVLPALESGTLRDLAADELPAGLLGYYEQHWRLLQGRDEGSWLDWKLPVLEALAVAAEPVPFDLVALGSGVDNDRYVRRALELWRPFLHVVERREPVGGEPVALYRIYHHSFREFLAERTDLDAALERMMEHFLEAGGQGGSGGPQGSSV